MSEAVSMHLAKNILELRKKRSWSQKDLSEYSKVPRSTITYLESGGGNPSLHVLIKIAEALHVGVDELLSQPRGQTKIYKPEDFQVLKRGAGKASIMKLLPDRMQGIEIDKMYFNHKASFAGHPHLHGTKEYLYVLMGEISVTVLGEIFVVPQGHLVAFPGDEPHTYRNTGNGEAEALSVVIPISKFAK